MANRAIYRGEAEGGGRGQFPPPGVYIIINHDNLKQKALVWLEITFFVGVKTENV